MEEDNGIEPSAILCAGTDFKSDSCPTRYPP